LTDALARSLGTALELETEVRSLARAGAGWRLGVTRHGIAAAWDCDDVVVASPAPAAARLLDAVLPSAARELASVKSAPVAVVALGYADAGGARALDGFGFLAARGEGLRCLGALAETNVWGREPRGFLVRVMLGGTPDPGALDLSDDELTAIARQDLRQACGLAAEPAVRRVARWRAAIPQYGHGHGTRVAAVESAAAALPGLHLAGAAYRGVALNDLCRGARDVALRIAARDRGRT
jgi:oxygen-dependent protoporphyrinogen oxidase